MYIKPNCVQFCPFLVKGMVQRKMESRLNLLREAVETELRTGR